MLIDVCGTSIFILTRKMILIRHIVVSDLDVGKLLGVGLRWGSFHSWASTIIWSYSFHVKSTRNLCNKFVKWIQYHVSLEFLQFTTLAFHYNVTAGLVLCFQSLSKWKKKRTILLYFHIIFIS